MVTETWFYNSQNGHVLWRIFGLLLYVPGFLTMETLGTYLVGQVETRNFSSAMCIDLNYWSRYLHWKRKHDWKRQQDTWQVANARSLKTEENMFVVKLITFLLNFFLEYRQSSDKSWLHSDTGYSTQTLGAPLSIVLHCGVDWWNLVSSATVIC